MGTEFANAGIPITGAQAWWDVVLDDPMRRMKTYMISWVTQTINTAKTDYMAANARLPQGKTLRTWPSVQTTLNQWQTMVVANNGQELRFVAATYFAAILLPQPPGGAGGEVAVLYESTNLVLPDEVRAVSLSPILAAGHQNFDIATNTKTGTRESRGGSGAYQLAFFLDPWRKFNVDLAISRNFSLEQQWHETSFMPESFRTWRGHSSLHVPFFAQSQ